MRKRKGCCREDLQKRKDLSLACWRSCRWCRWTCTSAVSSRTALPSRRAIAPTRSPSSATSSPASRISASPAASSTSPGARRTPAVSSISSSYSFTIPELNAKYRKTHVCVQRLVGIRQRQRQTEDLCFRSSLYSHWFLFSRSSRLPRPLHFFGWETI